MSARLYAVAQRGSRGDESAGSRWFIVNVSLIGYANKGVETLFGWGMGNLIIPYKEGVSGAYKAAGNRFPGDAGGYAQANELDYAICLPVKLISEWGLMFTLIAFICVVLKCMKRRIDIYVVILICYVYIQFDSYPFYSLWLFLYIANYYNANRHGISFFDIIS